MFSQIAVEHCQRLLFQFTTMFPKLELFDQLAMDLEKKEIEVDLS